MVFELLAFGGVIFWALVGILFLVITTQVHNNNLGWATTTLLIAVAAAILLTGAGKQLSNITLTDVLYAVGAYLLGAVVWSAIKWRMFFLPSLFERYNELRSAFLLTAGPNGEPLKEMPADPAVRKRFNDRADVSRLNISSNRMASHNKGRITGWMVFWPFSLLETFIGDFLVRIFDRLYKMVAGTYQRMSDGMASKYSELN